MSSELITLYNRIAQEKLQETGVVIWDSTLPLSAAYIQQCLNDPNETPPLYAWKCDDVIHIGYIAVEQYVDMIYNEFCNKYFDANGYCSEERYIAM